MNKILALASIPMVALSLFKCAGEKSSSDYQAQYNPTNILGNGRFSNDTVTIDGYEYKLSNEGQTNECTRIKELILGADYLGSNDLDDSGMSFTYSFRKNGMIIGYTSYEYTFYDNGYATISGRTGEKDSSGNSIYTRYYYKCDAKDAKALYDYVEGIVNDYKELERAKKAAEETATAAVDAFTLDDALSDIKSKNPLVVEFSSILASSTAYERKSDSELEDDGSIKELVINATYTLDSSSHHKPTTGDRTTNLKIKGTIQSEELPLNYTLSFNEENLSASLSVDTKDSFDRSYSRTYNYNLERNEVHSIFDNAFRLYEAKHPEEKGKE